MPGKHEYGEHLLIAPFFRCHLDEFVLRYIGTISERVRLTVADVEDALSSHPDEQPLNTRRLRVSVRDHPNGRAALSWYLGVEEEVDASRPLSLRAVFWAQAALLDYAKERLGHDPISGAVH